MVAQWLPHTQAHVCIPDRRKEERRHQLHFFLLPAKTKAFTIDPEYTDKAQVAIFFKSSPGFFAEIFGKSSQQQKLGLENLLTFLGYLSGCPYIQESIHSPFFII